MSTGYRELMARLAAVPTALAAEQAEIRQWYEEQVATADATLRDARRAVADAERALAEAEATLAWTDAQAHRLWQKLHGRWGRLGPTPPPAESVDPDDDPVDHVHAAAGAIGEAAGAPRSRGGWSPLVATVALLATAATLAVALWLNAR